MFLGRKKNVVRDSRDSDSWPVLESSGGEACRRCQIRNTATDGDKRVALVRRELATVPSYLTASRHTTTDGITVEMNNSASTIPVTELFTYGGHTADTEKKLSNAECLTWAIYLTITGELACLSLLSLSLLVCSPSH